MLTGRRVGYLCRDPFFGPATVTTNQAGGLTLIPLPIDADSNSDAAFDGIAGLRTVIATTAFGDAPAEVLVGGASAMIADVNSILDRNTPVLFAFVLGLSFLLLTVRPDRSQPRGGGPWPAGAGVAAGD